jgi:hypothetical protein
MSSELEPVQDEALDLAAAEVRADAIDLQALVGALAARLEDALPGFVQVRRRKVGGFRSKQTEVQSIAVGVGDQRFELARTPGGFECTRHAVVRGITLKREQRPVAEWLQEVVAAVTLQAAVGEQQRIALEQLIR